MTRTNDRKVWRQIGVALVSVTFICTGILVFGSHSAKAQDDYTFGTELVNKGSSTSPTEKNTENAVYNSLQEADQYADTIFTATTENVVIGTGGGAAFPGALTTDDASRRTYTEANTAGAATYQILRPNADGSPLTFTPTPTGTHYTCVDETTAGGNGDTDYVTGVANGNEDTYAMSDATGSGNFDVTMWHWSRGITTSSCAMQYGLDIGGANYLGGTATMTSISYANFSYTWTLNPATTAEWTLTQINALGVYLYMTDANPDTRTTQVGIKITLAPTASYQLDAQITYSGVTSTAQTVSYNVLCQGYRNGDTENVGVYAWNYITSAWDLKATISAGSDTDYNFDLTSQQRDSGANEVKLRLVDASNGDATQTVAYLDVLKVSRLELGYALDVELTATAVAQYGNITLRIKGYTSAETFNINIWNYTSSTYDLNKLSVTSLSNAWQTTIDLNDVNHRSGTTVKIQFVDGTASTSDLVQDTLYLDVVWVTRYHTNPTITSYGRSPANPNVGDSITWWMTYSDYDNEAPASGYPKVHIDSTDYLMGENNSGDTFYYDGKLYGMARNDIPGGSHTYYFITKDANSIEITTASTPFKVNRNPTLTVDAVTPATGSNGESFSFYATYTDADGDPPTYVKVNINSVDYTMTANGTGTYLTGYPYHYSKAMPGGVNPYYFKTKDANGTEVTTSPKNLVVNNPPTLNGYGRAPADPVYPPDQLNFTVTYTDVDNDPPTAIKWRENGGATQNLTMSAVDPTDTTYTDGKGYYLLITLSHGAHSYDFFATDGKKATSGGGNSVTIQNRAPTIDNKFVDDHEWRNTYWEYDYSYTDLDGDTVVFQMSTNASFLSINSASGLVYGTTSNPVGWYDVTIWCNDSYGGSDSDYFKLYVDNRIPVITNGPGADPATYRNIAWYYVFDATDADTDEIGWARSGQAWLTVDSSGNLSGTTSDTPGSYAFTIYANDSYGGSDSYAFTLHVNNRVPLIGSSGNTTQTEGTYLAYHILASDDDGDVLSYALSTNASWASISGAWVNGTAAGVGWYEFDVWANDSYSGSDSDHWDLTVEAAVENLAPYFTSEPICNWPNNTGYLYNVEAVDPESQPLYYDLFGDIVVEGFCTIDHETGQITGLPHLIGDFSAEVSAFDGVNTAWQNWSLHVYSNAPIIDSAPIETWQNGTAYLYEIHAHDPEDEVLTWGLEGNCTAFLILDGQTEKMTNLTGLIPGMGWWYVNVSVSDGYNAVWQNFTLTALNTAPSFTTSPVTSGQKNVSYYYKANADDLNNDTITFSLVEEPGWIFVDEITGEVEGTPTDYGVFSIKLRAFDGIAYSWQNYTLTVPEPDPPTPPIVPSDQPPSLIGVVMMIAIVALVMGLMFPLNKSRERRRKSRNDSPKVAKDKEMEHGKRG